jgi:Beta-propeller repeat
VTGFTASTDFPTTAGAFQTTHAGGFSDVFVTKLDATGSGLVYSTYLGGSAADQGNGIAVDGAGSAYVTGFTDSTDFPTTAGAVQTTHDSSFRDAFVAKIEFAVPLPTSKDQCKNGGWQTFGVFKNQGDCVSFVATKGKNPPSRP